ncbi:transcriptional regulator [Bacillota bacterium LX-D]|nr:transcriptional regulator [Bacillota bacterium LX-D]
MDIVRIGDKLIDREKIIDTVNAVLNLRLQGFSQQEIANRLNIDRTLISRLESIGEVRRGGRVALVGFPVGNVKEIEELLKEEGVEFYLLMTEKERLKFISEKSGQQIVNDTMDIIAKVKNYDIIFVIGSNYRIKLCQALFDKEIIGIEIGKSPIKRDVYVDPEELREMIRLVRQ